MTKNTRFWSSCALALSFFICTNASDASPHEALLKLQKQSAAQQAPRTTQAPKYKKVEREGLLEGSDILTNGNVWTIVPKTAILHTPDRLKSKVVTSPKGKFVSFKKFLQFNPAWIGTESVDIATACGKTALSESRTKLIHNSGKIIVAVHKKNPIGIHTLPSEEDSAVASR